MLPSYFNGMFDVIYPTHSYSTRQRGQPRLAGCKTKLAETAIRYSLPPAIAQLDDCISNKIQTHSITGLANYAKTYFITQYNPVCVIENCFICNN